MKKDRKKRPTITVNDVRTYLEQDKRFNEFLESGQLKYFSDVKIGEIAKRMDVKKSKVQKCLDELCDLIGCRWEINHPRYSIVLFKNKVQL